MSKDFRVGYRLSSGPPPDPTTATNWKRFWQFQTSTITIPGAVSPTVPATALSPKGNQLVRVTIAADRENSNHVCVGLANLLCTLNGLTNGAIGQIDPGRVMNIWVDDPDHEYFDLGDFFAATPEAFNMRLFITQWRFRDL